MPCVVKNAEVERERAHHLCVYAVVNSWTWPQVGRNVLRSRYNPATRRNEAFYDTEWWTVQPQWRYSRRWGVESPEAQVSDWVGGARRHTCSRAAHRAYGMQPRTMEHLPVQKDTWWVELF